MEIKNIYLNGCLLEDMGVMLRDGSIEELLTPAPLKDLFTNESYDMDGIQVIAPSPRPRIKERNLSLFFYVSGDDPGDYLKKYTCFLDEIRLGKEIGGVRTGIVELRVEELRTIFRLVYKNCQKYAFFGDTGGLLEIQFLEPDPTDRA